MKTKLITSAIYIALFYVLPLLGNPELMMTIQFAILIIGSVLLLNTQPPLTIDEAKSNKSRDKSSVWVIMGISAIIQFAMLIEWAYIGNDFSTFTWDIFTVFGLLLMASGITFRIVSIRTLGKSFTTTVRTQDSQTIVKTSVYKYLRHPSYLGAYIAIVGSTVFLHAYYSIIFSIIAMFLAYVYRINMEEKVLVEDFGNEYLDYQKSTNKMIPLIY